ncbi:Glycosyl transferase, family 9 [Pararhodospirillum photometricum DSM 122]|uniref:Glycosyl transferase, family 9 n=2 Tax=Pararhodospirillum photometricum TaxID=1084 RepID=H6SJE9_PARPM|nr:Glycosyl transferase, family 9 [Pararhodospirillum photometricum DSM 122]
MRRRDGGPLWSGIAPGCALPHTNPARDALHTLERQAEQLAEAGVPEAQPPALPDLSWCRTPVPAALAAPPTARLALLVPGAAPHRPAKRWPAARYAALAVALARDGLLPVVLGTSAEAKAARVILDACPEARDLTGQTSLLDLAALGRQAALAVGNDTGPMHLLAATGCPALVLFSAASDPTLCAPRGPRVRVFRAETLETVAFEPIYVEALDALVS